LKITLKDSGQTIHQNRPNNKNFRGKEQAQDLSASTISFKYTVDYPKIELHPFDTKKLSVLFNDTSDGQGAGQLIEQFTVSLKDNFDSRKSSASG
tara:strand:+ start:654 stop:938 length:285 start_codon:yes stop_codon:yes gene_type:complete